MKSGFRHFVIVACALLAVFQIKTTNFKEAYKLTPAQIDLNIRRMNSYPPNLARLGYILEVKKEVQVVNKVIENFFFAIDFKEYFPSKIPTALSPFLFIGLFYGVKERKKLDPIFPCFLAAVATLTILGPYGKYGPVLILPFLWLFVVVGFLKVLGFKKL